MDGDAMKFEFAEGTDMDRVEDAVHVAGAAVDGLHGRVASQLDAVQFIDRPGRSVTIETATAVGRSFAQVLHGLLENGIGASSFTVSRVEDQPAVA